MKFSTPRPPQKRMAKKNIIYEKAIFDIEFEESIQSSTQQQSVGQQLVLKMFQLCNMVGMCSRYLHSYSFALNIYTKCSLM